MRGPVFFRKKGKKKACEVLSATDSTIPEPYFIRGYQPERNPEQEKKERKRQQAKMKRMEARDEKIRQERARIAEWDSWNQEVE